MAAARHNEPAVEVDDLVQRFGSTRALDGVSFTVEPGEVFGLLGPNGAGKTTTIRILLTLLRPTSGRARVNGVDVVDEPDTVRRTVGWVPQERAVDPLLTGRENLTFAAGLHHLAPRRGRERAADLLEVVGLAADGDRLVRDYSGGMRRRLELAMGLIHVPAILFLDEPTLGLDIAARRRLWEQVARVRDAGTTILLTTHYLDEADALCDRVAVIDNGRIQAIAPPDALKRRHGRATLHLRFDTPPADLVARLGELPAVGEVRTAGNGQEQELELDADDLVAATESALAECRRLDALPTALWAERASLDDVFLALTGHGLVDAEEGEG